MGFHFLLQSSYYVYANANGFDFFFTSPNIRIDISSPTTDTIVRTPKNLTLMTPPPKLKPAKNCFGSGFIFFLLKKYFIITILQPMYRSVLKSKVLFMIAIRKGLSSKSTYSF